MGEVNLQEAFGRYKAKASPRGRSAITQDGTLVMSCWYTRFQKAESGVLRYEEDLTNETGSAADALRAHLAKALEGKYDVQLIVAVAPVAKAVVATGTVTAEPRPKATTFHARTDLLGQLTSFDGQRFTIEFRKRADAA
jgi:hypothetical protein